MKSNCDIKVSFFASAIRTERWLDFYRHIKETNRIPFEIVFVGPKSPDYKLPENFKFLQTHVKPSQCSEIARRNCRAEVLVQTVDDVEYSPGAIDKMYDELMKDEDSMTTCRYYFGDQDWSDRQNAFGFARPEVPFLPVCGMLRAKEIEHIGGIDRRYAAIMWELDLYMRLAVFRGLKTKFVDGICKEVEGVNPTSQRLSTRTWGHDRDLFMGMWNLNEFVTGKEAFIQRRWDLIPFADENLLTVSQPNAVDDLRAIQAAAAQATL